MQPERAKSGFVPPRWFFSGCRQAITDGVQFARR